jgi:hypothetical protein
VRGALEIAGLAAAGAVPAAAYLGVGLALLGPLGIRARGAERLAFAFAVGTGVASLALLSLRALGIPTPVLSARRAVRETFRRGASGRRRHRGCARWTRRARWSGR